MKIQCNCGAKYSFDITPEMAASPVRFICPACKLDISEPVNGLIRQEFATAPQEAAPEQPAPAIENPAPQKSTGPLRIQVQPRAAETKPAEEPQPARHYCKKHPNQLATERCAVCNKPICPQCMEILGYFCSAYCKSKAEAEHRDVPVYEKQKSVVEAKYWRKTGRNAAVVGSVVALIVGAWVWYSFIGSRPGVVFSVKFPERSYSGQCLLCPNNQLVVLHAGKLARHDMKTKKEVWSVVLIDKKKIQDETLATLKRMNEARLQAIDRNPDAADGWRLPREEQLFESFERAAIASLQLFAQDENVWVAFPDKLVRFDWQTGQKLKEVALTNPFHRLTPKGGELLFVEETETGERITHFSLASGESRVEEISGGRLGSLAAISAGMKKDAALTNAAPGAKSLDPAAVAANYQNLSFPAKLALPATVSAAANQQRALAEMRDTPDKPAPQQADVDPEFFERFTLVPDGEGFMQFSVRVIESKFISRTAMKAAPKKSALDGPVNAAASAAVANELLNEMQRNAGGDTVQEDASRYRVTFRRPGNDSGQWSGEVVGRPQLWPQKTVVALTAGKSVLVFDRSGKKLWESTLNYEVVGGYGGDFDDEDSAPHSPCVEHGDALYVFDQGVLSAFDLATGNARWRLPSVGVSQIFFDDKGALYANTTSASPDNIRFARQIDVNDKINPVIVKLDPKKGTILWQLQRKGRLNYVSGKFLYATDVQSGDEYAELNDLEKIGQALRGGPHVFIWRINPKNGEVMWEHYQERPPLDMRFDKNRIELLFKKELQVLKYFSL